MNFDTDHYTQSFGFDTFSRGSGDYSGPYIPEAIDCQRCGYCLRTCPTYKVKAEEAYSPRGRVRMIERVLKQKDVLNDGELAALNACTLCRTCEPACPSKMDYAGLYRQVMEAIEPKPQKSLAIKLLLHLSATGRSTQRALRALIHTYRRSGLQWLLRRLPRTPLKGDFKQLDALLPVPHATGKVPHHSQAADTAVRQGDVRQGEVTLFTGCVANTLDTETHTATTTLLTHLGYDVRILKTQTCCGAMHAHNGEMERAKALAQTNITAFCESGTDAILYNASGCGAFLSEYEMVLKDDAHDGSLERQPLIVDVLSFLVDDGRIGELSFRALKKRVAVHEPCSQRNVLKTQDVIYEALSRIPDLEVVPLPDNSMCCGAGGTKMVTQPELAAPPRDEKVQALIDSEAEILLSTNLTCALHLAQGVREAGRKVEVLHPVSLLAQQLM